MSEMCTFCSDASYDLDRRCHRCNHVRKAWHSVFMRPDSTGRLVFYHAEPEDPAVADPGWETRLQEVLRQNSLQGGLRSYEHAKHLLQCEWDRIRFFQPELSVKEQQALLTKTLRLAHPRSTHEALCPEPLAVILEGENFRITGW